MNDFMLQMKNNASNCICMYIFQTFRGNTSGPLLMLGPRFGLPPLQIPGCLLVIWGGLQWMEEICLVRHVLWKHDDWSRNSYLTFSSWKMVVGMAIAEIVCDQYWFGRYDLWPVWYRPKESTSKIYPRVVTAFRD